MNPYIAEFAGTGLLILLGNSIGANVTLNKTKGNNAGWIVITVGWGLAVLVPATIFGAASGAHFNPALTLAIAMTGGLPWARLPGYVIAQFAGAFSGASLVWLLFRDHFDQTPDPAVKRGVFSTSPAIRRASSNLISEIIGTFVLAFALLACKADAQTGNFYAWAVICVIGMGLGGTTGYAINPARDLGPRIAHAVLPIKGKGPSDWGYAWIPVAGPVIGAVLGGLAAKAIAS
jgi:glycerol uptake facilitator protein